MTRDHDAQRREWDAFVSQSHAKGLCEFSGMRATRCVATICDCFETPEGAALIERNADAATTPEWLDLNCPVCGSGGDGGCVCRPNVCACGHLRANHSRYGYHRTASGCDGPPCDMEVAQ